jgi:site-specific DNA-cytosine methylase
MSLRALDLFSGIGGITYGLRGIVTPIAYVEKNKDAREFLKKKHPDVPVFDDVCAFDATGWKGKVDIITAGWPCTGFSTAGKGTGFAHDASGLFTEIIRITKECEPGYLFLENSFIVGQVNNVNVIVDSFNTLDYDCKWLTCRATNVGALHERHRWFCLVTKRGRDIDDLPKLPNHENFDWSSGEPARQVETNTPENKLISSWLGNAVVPDQVRFAFTTLKDIDITQDAHLYSEKTNIGFSIDGKTFGRRVKFDARPPINIELTQETPPAVHKATTPHFPKIIKKYWATPVFSNVPLGSNILTDRCSKMLGTQLRYADGGENKYVNSNWVRWLMGYPDEYFMRACTLRETQS